MRMLLIALAFASVPGSRLTVPGVDQELIERTLALVGGQPITLSDSRAAIAFGFIEMDRPEAVVTRLVDRELVLREVQRYAPAAPAESAVEARLDEIRARLGGPAKLEALLDQHGFTDVRVRAWIRDDLRIQSYLAQRFASASTPTESDISTAYARTRAEFEKSGTTFEQAVPIIRERLIGSRRTELIADWISDLRRRTDVVILQR